MSSCSVFTQLPEFPFLSTAACGIAEQDCTYVISGFYHHLVLKILDTFLIFYVPSILLNSGCSVAYLFFFLRNCSIFIQSICARIWDVLSGRINEYLPTIDVHIFGVYFIAVTNMVLVPLVL
jgi:hypothetical protein